jgi:hypothetical protein
VHHQRTQTASLSLARNIHHADDAAAAVADSAAAAATAASEAAAERLQLPPSPLLLLLDVHFEGCNGSFKLHLAPEWESGQVLNLQMILE